MIRLIAVVMVLGGLVAGTACSGEPPPSRQDVLVALTETVIVPQFQSVADEMNNLREALETLCASPSAENLRSARDAWRDARAPWMRSQAMWFGPVMDRRSRSLVDWSPVDGERIEATLASRDAIAAADVRDFLGSTQRGLGAIEYLLFGDDAKIVASLRGPQALRCQYLAALGDVVASETGGVLADWAGSDSDSSGYDGYFNGTAPVALLDENAVAELVQTSVFLIRSVADMGLGQALGVDGGVPDVEAIPGGAGNNAVANLRNQLLGMQLIYVGASGEGKAGMGLSALVQPLSNDTDARMRDGFAQAAATIDLLEEPLLTSIAEDPGPAQAAYQRLKELQRVLNTEVVSLLGVTVGFSDTDGDGG